MSDYTGSGKSYGLRSRRGRYSSTSVLMHYAKALRYEEQDEIQRFLVIVMDY